ncbi:PREDICTED: uncharacterized protein LOC104733005 isoform X1 [Camelina sativa]|uniref:Uncharacterized protein LOC104733005 isoform X1 n=1 Tax=Camelina sativa TaxID=90675 RepID=A0ABM0V570_CAMSA|nr:PREDICTED: uncharacterized protein LOC104733005 isoform X1 [Camelina sativa]
MKRARVSSVYEGKERNRSRKGEETRRDQSKHARMTAKARISVHKESMKSLPPKHNSLVIMKSMRKKEETQKYQNKVIEKEKEEKDKGATEIMEEEMEMPNSKLVEDWPKILTYEEEWTWCAFAFGWGWWRRYHDTVMSVAYLGQVTAPCRTGEFACGPLDR